MQKNNSSVVYADANIILRLILNDVPEQSSYATNLLKTNTVVLLPEVIAEIVYVLHGVYKTDRNTISKVLQKILSVTLTDNAAVMNTALSFYGETNLDFVDCILAAYNKELGITVETFDKKLNNFIKQI